MRLALALTLLAACSHEQSTKEAWQLICASEAKFRTVDPSERAVKHAEYLQKHVTNAEAKEQLSSLATVNGGRAEIIELMLDEAGVPRASCADLVNITREQDSARRRAREAGY